MHHLNKILTNWSVGVKTFKEDVTPLGMEYVSNLNTRLLKSSIRLLLICSAILIIKIIML